MEHRAVARPVYKLRVTTRVLCLKQKRGWIIVFLQLIRVLMLLWFDNLSALGMLSSGRQNCDSYNVWTFNFCDPGSISSVCQDHVC